jgi:hypothetical protein
VPVDETRSTQLSSAKSPRPPVHDAFAVVSRKYLDGGNIPERFSSFPTTPRISSAQSAQVISPIPKCRRAA